MKQATILLLDLDSSCDLFDSLQSILNQSLNTEFKIQTRTLELEKNISTSAFDFGDFFKSALRSKPAMVFMAMRPSLLDIAGRVIKSFRGASANVPLIVVVDTQDQQTVIELLEQGASDFITTPLKPIDILPRVRRLLEHIRRQEAPIQALNQKIGLHRLVGESAALVSQIKKFPMVARSDATILLSGETGTGKEMCARTIHYLSPRAGNPFVPVNCGAIPTDLVENELFGHDREAFTGASSSKTGLIDEATGGTLFLDEIDCLPLLAQVKLLRFLQDKEFRPLGSIKTRHADVRVMAAANGDLEEAVKKGKLRQDLYYRLNVISLTLPPLRERCEDIPLLARHFLTRYCNEFDKKVRDFSESAMQTLIEYHWPGNVRELEHVIQSAVVLCEGDVLNNEDISISQLKPTSRQQSFQEMKAIMVAQFERTYISSILQTYRGNISKAARAARKDPRALRHLIRKHKIDVANYKDNS